ncbi:MAG: hypothetical protein MJ071_07930 [Oscillospiraceae bacterium]|nr:hypothetical protein [Oscillospiraceae bacterium]
MKKFAIALSVMMMTLMAGCGSTESAAPETDSSSVAEESVPVSSEDAVSEEASEESSLEEREPEKPIDWCGIQISVPKGFYWDEELNDLQNMYKTTDGEPTMYFGFDSRLRYYESEDTQQDDNLNAVPEVMHERLNHLIDMYYPSLETTLQDTQLKVEECTFLNFPALHITGVVNTDYADEQHEISYSAYYGIFDFMSMSSPHSPAMWICYAEGSSDELRAKLDAAAADVMTDAMLLSDEG